MRNKVRILGTVLLPFLMLAAPGCSKENSAADGDRSEPVGKTVENHAAEARKLIEAKREKAKSDCGTYLTARAGSGRVRYTDDAAADKDQLSFKCTVKANEGPLYDLVNLELYKIEPTSAGTAK